MYFHCHLKLNKSKPAWKTFIHFGLLISLDARAKVLAVVASDKETGHHRMDFGAVEAINVLGWHVFDKRLRNWCFSEKVCSRFDPFRSGDGISLYKL